MVAIIALSLRPSDSNPPKGGEWRSARGKMTDNAVQPSGNVAIGAKPDHETARSHGSMLKLTAAGTAVWIE